MTPTEQAPAGQLLAARLASLRDEVCQAARRAGRDPAAVTLVVVTKSAPATIFPLLLTAGVTDVGENRVQAAQSRRTGDGAAAVRLRWHLIGHLQSNKVPRALALFDVFHGIDSVELLQRLDAAAAAANRRPELLLQVNVSGEPSKHGLRPDALPGALACAARLRHVQVTGLMTMAPESADPQAARVHFRALAALRDACALPAAGLPLAKLSMGMSDDFAVAVEEGATLIRVGRRLLDGLLPDAISPAAHSLRHEHS